jgi:hypothetical protein
MLLAMLMFLCSCSISGKRELISFAVNHYGECKLLREEHKGSGNDEYRTVYLQDKETGIEYKVTSCLQNINVDGSSFGYVNDISSNFEVEYVDYLSSEADKKISSLERDYGCFFVFSVDSIDIYFDNRVEVDTAYDVAKSCDDILSDHDVKEMRPVEYTLYAEQTAYLGYYNAENKSGQTSNTYTVIDFVHKNYDPDAEFMDSIGAFANQFLTNDEVDKLFPDHAGMPSGMSYYFKGSDGKTFVAIDLKDFGASKHDIRIYHDTSRGMEQIEI